MPSTHDIILATVRDGSALTRKEWSEQNGRKFVPLDWAGRALVREWMKALRDGNIPQGEGKMRDGDRRCCLAVLAETDIGRQYVTITVNNAEAFAMQGDDPLFAYDGSTTALPAVLASMIGTADVGESAVDPTLWAAVTETYAAPRYGQTASGLNDMFDLTFPEIAEVVEHWFADDVTGDQEDDTGW
jgi:hypothetical protein